MSEVQAECRRLLGDQRFDALTAEIDELPESVDREAVLAIVRDRATLLRGVAVLDPKSKAQVDDALENLRQAIDRLKSGLRDSPWAKVLESEDAFVELWAGGLEREFQRITGRTSPLWHSLVSTGHVSAAGGRPKTSMARDVAALQKLGMSKHHAEFLLITAGLKSDNELLA